MAPTHAQRKSQQVTTPKQWRSKKNQTVELPSGNHAVLRRPGMEKFLSAGYLPDSLRSLLQEQIASTSGKPLKASELTSDMSIDEMSEWMSAMDRIAAHVFVIPEVRWHKRLGLGPDQKPLKDERGKPVYVDIPEEDRSEEFLYTDELDVEDKQFAFQYAVGGGTDLERFRAAAASLVDGVPAGANLEVSSERGPVSDGG